MLHNYVKRKKKACVNEPIDEQLSNCWPLAVNMDDEYVHGSSISKLHKQSRHVELNYSISAVKKVIGISIVIVNGVMCSK